MPAPFQGATSIGSETQSVALGWHAPAPSAPKSRILFERLESFFHLLKLRSPIGERRF
jgi:hypothetical protein